MGIFEKLKHVFLPDTQPTRKNSIQSHQKMYENNQRNKFNEWAAQATPCVITLSGGIVERLTVSDMPEYRTKSISKSTNPTKISDFVVIDLETTGLHARNCEIVELGAVRFDDFQPVEYFETFVKPKKPIPEETTKINGITNDMLETAPSISSVLPAFVSFIGNHPIVGHNLPFDLKFLFANGLDLVSQKRTLYDTLELSKKAFKKEYSYALQDICKECGIFAPISHRAVADCFLSGALFVAIIDSITGEDIRTL